MTVSVEAPTDNVQVGSSVPIEAANAHSPKPTASYSLDKIAETPRARRVQPLSPNCNSPFSTAKAIMTQDMDQEAFTEEAADQFDLVMSPHIQARPVQDPAEGYDADLAEASGLDTEGGIDGGMSMDDEAAAIPIAVPRTMAGMDGQADVPTKTDTEDEAEGADKDEDGHLSPSVVTQLSNKRPAENDSPIASPADNGLDRSRPKKRARGRPKKSESIGSCTPKPDPSEKRLRGRPKKDSSETSTPMPQRNGPSVVIERQTRNTNTPSSTITSDMVEEEEARFDTTSVQGAKPVVVFSLSSFPKLSNLFRVFKTFATIADTVTEDTDFLCIGKGGIKTTSKLLSAVARGKSVLSEDWALKCAQAKHLVDHIPYIARDADREAQENLPSHWSSGLPQTDLLSSHAVFITPALKKDYMGGFDDVKDLLSLVGAKDVISTSARNVTSKDKTLPEDTIIMALPHGDLDALTLHEKGYACYDKNFFHSAILRGQLSLDKFKIVPVTAPAKGKERKSLG